jgi:hypothetical protein
MSSFQSFIAILATNTLMDCFRFGGRFEGNFKMKMLQVLGPRLAATLSRFDRLFRKGWLPTQP